MASETTTTTFRTTRKPRAPRPVPRSYWDPNYYADPRNATLARSILYPKFSAKEFTEAAFHRAHVIANAEMIGPYAVRGMLDALSGSPTVSPGVATGLAAYADRAILPPEMITEILALDSQARAADPAVTANRKPDQGSTGESSGALSNILGSITRPMFALASMPYEFVIGSVRSIVADITTRDPKYDLGFQIGETEANPLAQSSGGQLIAGIFNPEISADMGEGYIPRGDVQARQIAAARAAAPLVFGHAWTLGRGIGSMMFDDPESLAYKNVSGFIDLVTNVALDPTVIIGKAGSAARAFRGATEEATRRSLGAATGVALAERETSELVEAAGELGRRTEVLSRATMDAANEVVRTTSLTQAESVATAAAHGGYDELVDLTARRDALSDTESILRSTPVSPTMRRKADRAAEATVLSNAIADVRSGLGDEGLDAMTAKITADAPEMPGVFTDAVPLSVSDAPRALPGSDNGVDAIVLYDTNAQPLLRSVDDPLDDPDSLVAALNKDKRGKSTERKAALDRLAATASRPNSTYGDLLTEAINGQTAASVYTYLRNSDIDGITDVFRLNGGEAGVWWTSPNIRVARDTPDGWQVYDDTRKGLSERIKTVKAERKTIDEALVGARKKVSATNGIMRQMALQHQKTVDKHTSVADSYLAVRAAVEQAYGVRRPVGKPPQISHELLKEALFGNPKSFDAAMGVGDALPGTLKAGEVANRAVVGLMTLGLSEAARAARRAIEPFTARTREAVFEAMVKLGDTPGNLGMLQRLTNNQIDPEILKGVLRARSEDEVLEVLGPALGISITRPIGPDLLNAQRLRISRMTSGNTNRVWSRAVQWMLDTAARESTIAPRFGVHLNFADPQGSAELFRNYLSNLPGLKVEAIDGMIGRYLSRTTEVGRAKEVRQAMNEVANEMSAWTSERLGLSPATAEALKDAMKLATRTHEGGRAKVNDWWTNRYSHDAHVGYTTVDGQLVHLVGPQLEAELSRGGLVLPNMQAMRDAAGRWGREVNRHPGLKKLRDAMDTGMDFWRSSVLFRYAYIVRNVSEMQFRMFLTGHSSIFNDPLGSLAMASGMNKKTLASRGLFARFARYNKTATGQTLGAVDDDMLEALDNVIPEYVTIMQRTTSHHDMRSVRGAEAFHDVVPVGVDQPGFFNGWAEQLVTLTNDPLARLVAGFNPPEVQAALKAGANRDAVIVDYVMRSPAMGSLRRNYEEAGESYAQIFADPVALRAYLFDSSQGGRVADVSIRARIQEYTAGNSDLTGLIATGALVRDGRSLFLMSSKHKVPEIRQELITTRAERLARQLREYRPLLPDDYQLNMRVLRGGNTAPGVANRIFNWFFTFSGRKENAWAMGPEFSYAYNDAIVDLMPSMTMTARQEVFDFVKTANGRWRPNSEVIMRARAAMKSSEGHLIAEDVEKVAAQRAADHVKTLFYDAQQRKQIFHSLRLVTPFAQPFFNTLYSWGRLMAARPYMMEKIGRLASGLTEPGSGVIYDDFDVIDPFTDRQSRDPTQGFIYKHPETGEMMFSFPLIGSVLGAAMSPFVGFNAAESMQLAAPVQNLNLAFQGDVDYLPGVGPLLSIPTSILMPDDWYASAPEWFREYVFPFGEPRLEGGLFESIAFPSWARRLTGALYNDDFRSYSYRGMLAYFASTKDYPNLAGDPRMQQMLQDDVQLGSKVLTAIRAIGAAFLPAAPTQDIYAADKDGQLIGQVYLAHHFNHIKDELGGDFEAATKAFVDTYGMQALAALVPVTEGEPPVSGPGWNWYKEHGEEAKAYSDVIGWFFPGDFSYDAHQWSLNSGNRERLSIKERTDRLMSMLYNARKTALEGRGALEGWDADQLETAEQELKDSFGGVLPQFTGEDAAAKLAKIRRALGQFEDLRDTRAGEGAQLLFEAYDRHVEEAEFRYGVGLQAKRAETVRNEFLDELDLIVDEYGGFNAAEGSVETVAHFFRSAVQPRS